MQLYTTEELQRLVSAWGDDLKHTSSPEQAFEAWHATVVEKLESSDIPKMQWVNATTLLVSEPIRSRVEQPGDVTHSWEAFLLSLRNAHANIQEEDDELEADPATTLVIEEDLNEDQPQAPTPTTTRPHMTNEKLREVVTAWGDNLRLTDSPHENFDTWTAAIEKELISSDIRAGQWIEATLSLLAESIKSQFSSDITDLPWKDFIAQLKEAHQEAHTRPSDNRDLVHHTTGAQAGENVVIVDHLDGNQLQAALDSVRERADQLRRDNPTLATIGGITLIYSGGTVVVPAVLAALLLAAGFGPLGPVAGTLAPWLQSVFWGAQTGGLFSVLQSAGMTIAAPSAVATTLGGVAASVGAWLGFGGRDAPAAAPPAGAIPATPPANPPHDGDDRKD